MNTGRLETGAWQSVALRVVLVMHYNVRLYQQYIIFIVVTIAYRCRIAVRYLGGI